jgi:hypothetical protein
MAQPSLPLQGIGICDTERWIELLRCPKLDLLLQMDTHSGTTFPAQFQ